MLHQDRTDQVMAHILPSIQQHQKNSSGSGQRPFILGLTGLQGCGKSTLATEIVTRLNVVHHIRALEVSLDDFYLVHDELESLAPQNKLMQVRGQPGTHDLQLAEAVFEQFSNETTRRVNARGFLDVDEEDIVLPVFDKSLHGGKGDRLGRESWRTVKEKPQIQVLVFEGWCVGFRACSDEEIRMKWERAQRERGAYVKPQIAAVDSRKSTTTLAEHSLADLQSVNEKLRDYNNRFMGPTHLDFLVHLDTPELINVYTWRIQQEQAMRLTKKRGMTYEQVIDFVKGYMPSYELYLEKLREGFFKDISPLVVSKKQQLHVVMDENRDILEIKLL